MPHVYILQFPSGTFYVGSTTNLTQRLVHHAGGHTPSTRALGKGTGKLVLAQEYDSLTEARAVERKIKKLKRSDYVAQMVVDGYIKIDP